MDGRAQAQHGLGRRQLERRKQVRNVCPCLQLGKIERHQDVPEVVRPHALDELKADLAAEESREHGDELRPPVVLREPEPREVHGPARRDRLRLLIITGSPAPTTRAATAPTAAASPAPTVHRALTVTGSPRLKVSLKTTSLLDQRGAHSEWGVMSGAKERFERAKAGIAPAKGVMDGIRKDMQAEKLGLKPKGGTAWSHGFLNQKYWHPLSYRNQERLFKAEQEEEARRRGTSSRRRSSRSRLSSSRTPSC